MSTQALSSVSERLAFYRRAANYIAVAMIYLQDNHLLEEPLKPEHVKHRLLGHWGTVPGINLIYAGLNRLILDTDSSMLLVTGPGHGAPANLANLWIDGCLEDIKPEMSRDREGLSKLVRLFSWPGGFPSHIAPIVPGTIHEGGELGYALATAFGAALDNPELIVACIVGDGEAETGPTAGAWHSNKFLDPAGSGAVLPILHLNGYKIANPTIFASMSDTELTKLFEGYGWHPMIVQGEDLDGELARALDSAHGEIRELQSAAREGNRPARPTWPMLIVRSPKGWTGIRELDGVQVEGTSKSHQVPAMQARTNPAHLQALEGWLRSYGPEELFDESGGPAPEIAAMCPSGDLRMGANPHVNGGRMRVALTLPELKDHAVALERARRHERELARRGRQVPQQRLRAQPRAAQLPRGVPGRGRLQPSGGAVRGRGPRLRVAGRPGDQPRLQARRAHHGGPLRAQLPGLAAGLRADGPPRDLPLLRGVHPDRRRDGQPVREVPEDVA